jgi:hypothetical protein
MLGMPTRQRIMDRVIEAFDTSRPKEYGCSLTMLGKRTVTCLLSVCCNLWFNASPSPVYAFIRIIPYCVVPSRLLLTSHLRVKAVDPKLPLPS